MHHVHDDARKNAHPSADDGSATNACFLRTGLSEDVVAEEACKGGWDCSAAFIRCAFRLLIAGRRSRVFRNLFANLDDRAISFSAFLRNPAKREHATRSE